MFLIIRKYTYNRATLGSKNILKSPHLNLLLNERSLFVMNPPIPSLSFKRPFSRHSGPLKAFAQ